MSETEGMAYERLREAVRALGGSLEHTKPDQPRGGTWLLQLGGRTLEMPSQQAMRYPELDACYRLKPGVAASRTWKDHTNEIEPLGLAKLFERLAKEGTMTDRTTTPSPTDPRRARLEARLKEWSVLATADFKRVFGVAPGRWLQMETQYGTLVACQRLLTPNPDDPDGWVTVLTPMWEKKRLDMSAEAAAVSKEFAPLFTEAEQAVARVRLKKFGYEVK